MDSPDSSHRTYQNHRENQRERILDAAEALFVQNGIDNVSISDIAWSAKISRVTLYEYFPNKEEIAWAVFRKVSIDLLEGISDHIKNMPGCGYDKLAWFMNYRVDSLIKNPDHFRFIAAFNFLYAREGSSERMRRLLDSIWPDGFDLPAVMIREGIADGSIRGDLNADLVSSVVFNLMAGMTHRFSLLGPNMQGEYGQSAPELFRELNRIFLCGLKSI